MGMEWKCTCSSAASEMAAPMNTKGSSRIQRRSVSVNGYKVSVNGYNVVMSFSRMIRSSGRNVISFSE